MARFCLFTLTAFLLFLHQGLAQQGVYDLRLNLKKVDCGNQKAFVDVEIKAHDESGAFLMGNANFRFTYDARFLQNPILIEQINFTGAGKNPNENYNPQTLTGSSERIHMGIVSLNIVHNGSDQKNTQVTSDQWMPVATLQFDLVNPRATEPTILSWNDDHTFPVTGLSEVVVKKEGTNPGARVAKASGIFENLRIDPISSLCNGTGKIEKADLMIPEGFSPNGDGVNDRFVIFHLGDTKANITIYTRDGRMVYENTNYQNDWDGRTGSGALPDGVYFYTLRLSDGRTFQRSLTISY